MKSIHVWRFSHRRFAGDSFSGEGARMYGGRFNSECRPLVYTSGGLSLAILELLIRVRNPTRLSDYVLFRADIPEKLISEVTIDHLPEDWNSLPYGSASQAVGDKWLKSESSAVLKVPSVIVPSEYNYLMNPLHPDFRNIRYSETDDFSFDRRFMEVLP